MGKLQDEKYPSLESHDETQNARFTRLSIVRTEFGGLLRTPSRKMDPLGGLITSIRGQIDAELLFFSQTVQDRLQDGLDSRDDRSRRSRIARLGDNLLSIAGHDVHCCSIPGNLHVIGRQMVCSQSRTLEQPVNWNRAVQLEVSDCGLETEFENDCRIRLRGPTAQLHLVASLAALAQKCPPRWLPAPPNRDQWMSPSGTSTAKQRQIA